jgi:hypothetical protein
MSAPVISAPVITVSRNARMCSDAFPSRFAATLALALIAVWPRAALSAETPPSVPVAVSASAPAPNATPAPSEVETIAVPAAAAPTDNPPGAKSVDASEATPAEATPAESTRIEATRIESTEVESTQAQAASTQTTAGQPTPTPDPPTPTASAEAQTAPVDVIAPAGPASSVDAATVEAAAVAATNVDAASVEVASIEAASVEAAAQQAAAEALAAADAARVQAEAAETAAAAAEAAAAQAISDAVDAAMSAAPRASTSAPAAPAKTVSKRKPPPTTVVQPLAQPAAAEPVAAEPAAIPLIEDTNAPPPTPSAVESTPAASSIPTANQPAPPAFAAPAVAVPAVAAPAARLPPTPRALGLPLPQPGEYIAADGAGRLDIVAVAPAAPARRRDAAPPPAALDFTLRSFGSNGHVCALEGRIVDGSAQLPTGDGVPACIVSFVATQTGVQTIDDSRTCRYFCGSHASFEGIYLRPAPGCDDAGRAATRGLFQTLYAAGDLPRAQARLSGLLEHCDNTLHWLERAQIANDLARIHARLGRREDCLQTLAPMSRDAALDDASLGEGFLPEDAAAYLPQVRAARDTLRRCRALPVAGAARAQSNALTGMPVDLPAEIPADLPADKPDPAHVGGGQR